MAPSQHPPLRKAAPAATKRTTVRGKAAPKATEEPLEDLSHLSPMDQLLEATKHIPAHKIKLWPIRK